MEEKQEQLTPHLVDMEEELKLQPTGTFVKKEIFLGGEEIVIQNLGVNQFGKWVLYGLLDGQEVGVNISKSNYNELIGMFGKSLKEWVGKSVIITSKYFEGDKEKGVTAGYTLTFERA